MDKQKDVVLRVTVTASEAEEIWAAVKREGGQLASFSDMARRVIFAHIRQNVNSNGAIPPS